MFIISRLFRIFFTFLFFPFSPPPSTVSIFAFHLFSQVQNEKEKKDIGKLLPQKHKTKKELFWIFLENNFSFSK